MKRLSVFMLCAVIVLFSVIGYYIPVEANNKLSGNEEAFYDNTWLNNFDYTLSDNDLILNRYTGSATDLVIPSKATVDGVEYNVKLNNYCGYLFSGNQSLRTITFDRYIDTSNVIDMSGMFCGCTNLVSIDMSGFDTRNVTDMSGMFAQCTSLDNLDVSGFDTHNVKYMFDMFAGCYVRKLDLSHWDLSNLEIKSTEQYIQDYRSMFVNCLRLSEIKTPINLKIDVPINNIMLQNSKSIIWYQEGNEGAWYSSLPINQTNSITLKNDSTYIPIIGISVSPSEKTIKVGESFNISFELMPSNASNYIVYESSSNPSVANVWFNQSDKKYYVVGVCEGTAVITFVTAETGQSASCTVTVKGEIEKEKEIKQINDYSWEVLDLVNQERAKVGVGPLVMDKGLLKAAQQRAEEITILFSHTRLNGEPCSTALPKGYNSIVGENIAKGQDNPSEVMQSWMNSTGHRNNILYEQYKSIGIACVCVPGAWRDEYHWVQVFYGDVVEPVLKGGVPTTPVITDEGTIPMYRMYNPYTGEHFYTSNYSEVVYLGQIGWQYEDVAWNAPLDGGEPVYRLYNPFTGDHHYTLDIGERDYLDGIGWNYEGVAWNSGADSGTPVYRLFNPFLSIGSHHYTTSLNERDYLLANGWLDEGIAWYAAN